MTSTPRDPQRYDATTIALHWLVMAMVVVLWVGARTLELFPSGAPRADARTFHIAIGLALGLLGGGRLVWRLSFGRPLPPQPGLAGALAQGVHNSLYFLLAVMVGAGILLAWTTGDSVFASYPVPPLDPETRARAAHILKFHDLIGWAILALAALHAAAVLYHRIILKDAVMGRMLPRGRGGG